MCCTIVASTPCFNMHQHSLHGFLDIRHNLVFYIECDAMQSLWMTELWITGNTKKKLNVNGKSAKNVVYFPRLNFV